MRYAGNAGAPACNAGSSGVTELGITEVECFERASAFLATLAGEGACVLGMAACVPGGASPVRKPARQQGRYL